MKKNPDLVIIMKLKKDSDLKKGSKLLIKKILFTRHVFFYYYSCISFCLQLMKVTKY